MWGRGAAFAVALNANSIRITRRKHYMVKRIICGGEDSFGEEFELGRHECLGRSSRLISFEPY